MKKGFMFTLDVLVALFLLTVLLFIVISQQYGGTQLDSLYLRSYSMGMLASFEKSGLLASSISGPSGPSRLRQTLNALPPNICARITIANSTDETVLDVRNARCGDAGQKYYITYRTLYANGELYTVRARVWPR